MTSSRNSRPSSSPRPSRSSLLDALDACRTRRQNAKQDAEAMDYLELQLLRKLEVA